MSCANSGRDLIYLFFLEMVAASKIPELRCTFEFGVQACLEDAILFLRQQKTLNIRWLLQNAMGPVLLLSLLYRKMRPVGLHTFPTRCLGILCVVVKVKFGVKCEGFITNTNVSY